MHHLLSEQTCHLVTMLHCNFLEHYLTLDSSFTIQNPAFSGTSYFCTSQDNMTKLVVVKTGDQKVPRWCNCKEYAVHTVLLMQVSECDHVDVSTFKHRTDWRRHTSLPSCVSVKEWLSFRIVNKIFPGLQVGKRGQFVTESMCCL